MRIELKRRHRFDDRAHRRSVVVETTQLPQHERQLVERLVTESGLLVPRATATRRPIPDTFSYTFIVEDTGGRKHSVSVGQSELTPVLGKLVAMLVWRGGE